MGKTIKQYWVYMMTNTNNTVIYTGVTNDLEKRIFQHKNKKASSFTSRYNVIKLVYYEPFNQIYDAIAAEKKIKAGSRAKKIQLIESFNPNWADLYDQDNSLTLKIASLRSQ
jgi:putative endonuclease